MNESIKSYREGHAELEIDNGFFKPGSILARDISVLIATMQLNSSEGGDSLHWLDLMTGCGIRALRWGLEASVLDPSSKTKKGICQKPNIWANDGNSDRKGLINRNLKELIKKGIEPKITSEFAESFLARSFLNKISFDLIDIDSFGSANKFVYPAINVLKDNGILILSSSDGRSCTGHDRINAIKNHCAAVRVHNASWEIALRVQIASLAKQAWQMGKGIKPLVSFSDGRTFRICVKIKKEFESQEETNIGFLAKCNQCGDQQSQPLLRLKGWGNCYCNNGKSNWIISGPIWLGLLQDQESINKIQRLANLIPIPIVKPSKKLLEKLRDDTGSPCFSWSSHELAQRCALKETPPLDSIIKILINRNYQGVKNGLIPGHIRTDASLKELLSIYEGFK